MHHEHQVFIGDKDDVLPGVFERRDLALRDLTVGRMKNLAVGGVRIERRVEIEEVDAGIGKLLSRQIFFRAQLRAA